MNPQSPWFDGFESRRFEVNGASIQARFSKVAIGRPQRPALLLLHGFPQSHAMWHRVAQQLGQSYFLVLPDLRGYGDSSKTPGLPDHGNYSKRNMAHDMVAVMDALGQGSFYLCGHDRGGRVVHRLFDPMALWQAQCSRKVAGHAMAAGHFIPEEQPEATARALRQFFS